MAEEWLTYSELGERLGISSEAARQKAIRYRWRRRPANDGKAQVLVDFEDVRIATSSRKPREEAADDRPTSEEHPSDARTFGALDAHIETLKEMVAKAEAIAERERQHADEERDRADRERERAGDERARADILMTRVEELLGHEAEANGLRNEVSRMEEKLAELRARIDAAARRSWWRHLVG